MRGEPITSAASSHCARARGDTAAGYRRSAAHVVPEPLYGEFVATWGAYSALAGLIGLVVDDESPAQSLAVFACGVLCLAMSRMQHVLLPLFFILVLAC